jgi:hypothetical protein
MNSDIAVVVMGGRPGSATRWGGYTIEALVEMCKWGDRLEVVTGVLTNECENIRGV